MVTIDKRVDELIAEIPFEPSKGMRSLFRAAFQVVARDQREACASAVLDVCNHATQYKVGGETVYQAVLAAELK